jgi:hypothetical protein
VKWGSTTNPAFDPKFLLARLHARLDKERPGLERWHQRLVRTFHAYERQHRLVNRLARRVAKLDTA